jgi:hypothetical protein
MDPLLEILAKGGVGIVACYVIVKWLAKTIDRLFTRFDEQASAMMKGCAEERSELTKRIQLVEDRTYQSQNDILFACAQALEVNARAFKQLSDATDKFPAVDRNKKDNK